MTFYVDRIEEGVATGELLINDTSLGEIDVPAERGMREGNVYQCTFRKVTVRAQAPKNVRQRDTGNIRL